MRSVVARTCHQSMPIIFGIHAVEEALAARSRGFEYVAVAAGRGDQRVQKLIDVCRSEGITGRPMPRDQLTRLARAGSHQGVVAITAEKKYHDLADLIGQKRGPDRFLPL